MRGCVYLAFKIGRKQSNVQILIIAVSSCLLEQDLWAWFKVEPARDKSELGM